MNINTCVNTNHSHTNPANSGDISTFSTFSGLLSSSLGVPFNSERDGESAVPIIMHSMAWRALSHSDGKGRTAPTD